MKIQNPILKGFNPDPTIVRVEDDYYIATSTFEWFPGICIYHSKDLANWRLLTRPLDNADILDLRGVENSGGIWAPCLSHDGSEFHLIYTIVRSWSGIFKDTHNFLITAKDICGPWSEPVFLNSNGFDGSMFHDDDCRKYFMSVQWDHTSARRFGGTVMQEYCPSRKKLIGEEKVIFGTTEFGRTISEGAHIYKKDGYYYLMLADGGTGIMHGVTLHRSRNIWGQYEQCPHNPIMTSRFTPENPLQKAGHADIVQTRQGEWYMVHLCSRFIGRHGSCPLGRETAIQKISWTDDGWIEVYQNQPQLEVDTPDIPEYKFPETQLKRDDFDDTELNINFHTLRIPATERILSLTQRRGYLRLFGRESLNSLFEQALVARRQQSFRCIASCAMEFEPDSFKQMAGLICMLDTDNYLYLHKTCNSSGDTVLSLLKCDNQNYSYEQKDIAVNRGKIYLRADINYDFITFYYSYNQTEWLQVSQPVLSNFLSDQGKKLKFTGSFVGLACQDLKGLGRYADFDWFEC